MKQLFLKLKSKAKNKIQTLLKKPLFLEIIMGSILSIVVVVISVSGFEKAVYKESFDEFNYDEEYDNGIIEDGETGIGWDDIEMGDALSLLAPSSTDIPSASRNQTPPSTPAPTYIVLETPSSTILPTAEPTEEEIEVLPEITLQPEVTPTPEPEVILDPNGPVIVSDMGDSHITYSKLESITITAYNSIGEKLPHQNIWVTLNDNVIFPTVEYNGSYTYLLDYKYMRNYITVQVHDENYNSKQYDYYVYYDIISDEPAIVSVDASSVGLGYIIKPTAVEITEGKTVAAYVKEILSQNSYSTFGKGSTNYNYEFRGLYRSDLYLKKEPAINEKISEYFLNNAIELAPTDYYFNFIKNGYFLGSSKWIFEINGVKHFDSMSNYTLQPGDILKVRFALYDGTELDYIDNSYVYEPVVTETPTEIPVEPVEEASIDAITEIPEL